MQEGYLSQYFLGAAAKTLASVEVDHERSHQHEFNGSLSLVNLFGETLEKRRYSAKCLYLDDDELPLETTTELTWYDARKKGRLSGGADRTEYRFYFKPNLVFKKASVGDLLVLAKQPDGNLLALVAAAGSTIASQISFLFGFENKKARGFQEGVKVAHNSSKLAFASRLILDNIGVEVQDDAGNYLEDLLAQFGTDFPTTKIFSEYARSTVVGPSPVEAPDDLLMRWVDREDLLFRALERHFVSERLAIGFEDDVDGFIKYSLSILNRRKSRAGLSFENHLQCIFELNELSFSRGQMTENRSKPDFIFPSISAYLDPHFTEGDLTMLGVKTTCKDRWRQILPEADRITKKHLATLECALSLGQTGEMAKRELQLVIPRENFATFHESQRPHLMDVQHFISRTKKLEH